MGQDNTKMAPNSGPKSDAVPQVKKKLPRFKERKGRDLETKDYPLILKDVPGVEDKLLALCDQIDLDLREEWTLLYRSDTHGKSFNRFNTHCIERGPTFVFIRDTGGHIFGGFASESWKKPNPTWYGSAKCFIFQLAPGLNIYRASGYNDHFMYLNGGVETLPNGVGMGGQHNFFGWCLTSDFDHGHSNGPCATFESPVLSSARNFQTDTIEVWSCKLPPQEDELGRPLPDPMESVDEEGDENDSSDEEEEDIKGMDLEQQKALRKMRESKRRNKQSVLRTENNPDKVIMDLLGKTGQYHEKVEEPLEEELAPDRKSVV